MARIVWLGAAALAAGGCWRPSIEPEEVHLRKEIVELEGRIRPEGPAYLPEFDALLRDDDLSMPAGLYHHVLRRLAAMSDAELRGQVDRSVGYGTMVDRPSAARGRTVFAQGYIARVWAEPVEIEGFPGAQVFAGILFVENRWPLLFHVIEKPPLLYLKQDLVSVEGVFLKVVEYEMQGGGILRAPLVVGRRLQKYH